MYVRLCTLKLARKSEVAETALVIVGATTPTEIGISASWHGASIKAVSIFTAEPDHEKKGTVMVSSLPPLRASLLIGKHKKEQNEMAGKPDFEIASRVHTHKPTKHRRLLSVFCTNLFVSTHKLLLLLVCVTLAVSGANDFHCLTSLLSITRPGWK